MSPHRKLENLVADFAILDDLQERLTLVVDRAKRTPPLPPAQRTEANRVRGCVSVVWLAPELRAGVCHFHGDAESPLVRGLVVLTCDYFSGFPPAELAGTTLDPLAALGLTPNLSPTRRNGLAAVRQAIRAYSEARLPTA